MEMTSAYDGSSLATIPVNDLDFQVGHMVGRGAFACVYLCFGFESGSKTFATKFINKPFAKKVGRITRKDIVAELVLHNLCSKHKNIVSVFGSGENDEWVWLKMEAAMGGDLFDKIEPDVGVHEDICQLYFQQLVGAIEFIHSQGIAHRDIKPENILLDENGNLLLSDFGFAALYRYDGQQRTSSTVCGSPPYVAPEVLLRSHYAPDLADIWSCGIVLFVLLCGCTPWECAAYDDPDFSRYRRSNGRVNEYPWNGIPLSALSLIRSLVRVNPNDRITLKNARKHPWFTRPNRLISPSGQCTDPLELAERLILNMHVDLNDSAVPEDRRPVAERYMSASQPQSRGRLQRENYMTGYDALQSQPDVMSRGFSNTQIPGSMGGQDMAMLQFSRQKPTHIPESYTQRARRFNEICPPSTLNKFFSALPLTPLYSHLSGALHSLGIDTEDLQDSIKISSGLMIRLNARDRRKCQLSGFIKCSQVGDSLVEVLFEKVKGDNLEWRYLFKKVALLCKDVIYAEQLI